MTPRLCDHDPVRVHAFLDEELDAAEAATVAAHLQRCSECAATYREARAIRATVRDMNLAIAPSAALRASITAQLHETGGQRGRWLPRWPQWAAAAAALVAGLVLALAQSAGEPTGPRLSPPPRFLAVGDFVADAAAGDPERFWTRFAAIETTSRASSSLLDFEPTIPETLPGGYQLERVRLLKDVCCYTVQLRYTSPSGALDVFQCHDDHPLSFGGAKLNRDRVADVAYTNLEWADLPTRGRVFRRGDLNIVVVGDLDVPTADALTLELSNGTN